MSARAVITAVLAVCVVVGGAAWWVHQQPQQEVAAPEAPQSPTSAPPQGTGRPTPSGSSSSSSTPSATPEEDHDHSDVDEEEHQNPTPVAPTGARADAAQAMAVRFVKAYARPAGDKVDARTWWAQVSPMLTAQARADYAGTDPSNVPFTKVTGEAKVKPVQDDHGLVILVVVPTDVGDLTVHLVGDPLAVSRLTFPKR